jgi:hypothetical protein
VLGGHPVCKSYFILNMNDISCCYSGPTSRPVCERKVESAAQRVRNFLISLNPNICHCRHRRSNLDPILNQLHNIFICICDVWLSYATIYAWVFQVVSFLDKIPPKLYMNFNFCNTRRMFSPYNYGDNVP